MQDGLLLLLSNVQIKDAKFCRFFGCWFMISDVFTGRFSMCDLRYFLNHEDFPAESADSRRKEISTIITNQPHLRSCFPGGYKKNRL